MKKIDLLIKNGIFITMDHRRRIFNGGFVATKKDHIVDIGASKETPEYDDAEEIIDAEGMMVLPGFVDSHNHCDGTTLANGLASDLTLEESYDKIFSNFSFGPKVEPRHNYMGAMIACLISIKNGVTCVANNHAAHSDEIAGAFKKSGLRSMLSQSIKDIWPSETKPGYMPDRKRALAETFEFIQKWDGEGNGRLRTCFGPITEFTVSKELFKDIVSMAEKYDKGIHVHLAETMSVVSEIKRIHGKRSVEFAYELGVLRPGTVVGHGCWLTPHEINLLAETGTSVSHTPVSEMILSDGITPVPQLLDAGVNTSLGRDTHYDMIREMSTAALLHKVSYPFDPELVRAEHVLEMATINGAKALRWDDEIGSLEKGKKADIIIIDMAKPHLIPLVRKPRLNAVNLLVYRASGGDVDTVIVDGNILMKNRKVLSMDEGQVMKDAEGAALELIEITGLKNKSIPLRWSHIPIEHKQN